MSWGFLTPLLFLQCQVEQTSQNFVRRLFTLSVQLNRTETAINFYIFCMGLFNLLSLARLKYFFLANQDTGKKYQIWGVVKGQQFYRRQGSIDLIMQIHRSLTRTPPNIKDGVICNNSKCLKAINYCSKVLHFTSLWGYWLQLQYKSSKHIASENIVKENWLCILQKLLKISVKEPK